MMLGKTVGCLGGGQLGRMMAEAAHRMGVKFISLDPLGSDSPAGLICHASIKGDFRGSNKTLFVLCVAMDPIILLPYLL